MDLIKIVIMIAVTMALSITLTMTSIGNNNAQEWEDHQVVAVQSGGRVSRFLAEKAANPKAADHCKKDNEACYVHGLNATTCCNNKCVDVYEDRHNCGGCKSKCKYTYTCCRGKCVDTDYDKRHCGACGNKCKPGVLCLYGMCDYSK